MKKILSVLLLMISTIYVSFAFGGCFSAPIRLFTVGEYETSTVLCMDDHDTVEVPSMKAKLIIQPITEEEFEKADGINVIKNRSSKKENNIYYSFELFLYDDTQEDYVQVEISDLYHHDGTPPNMYMGEMKCNLGDCELVHQLILEYDNAYSVVITYNEADSRLNLLFRIVS